MFKQLCTVQKKHTLKRNQMERHMNILTKVYFAGRGESLGMRPPKGGIH